MPFGKSGNSVIEGQRKHLLKKITQVVFVTNTHFISYFSILTRFFSVPILKKSRYSCPKLFFGSANFTHQSFYQAQIQRTWPSGKIFLKAMKKICQIENGQQVLLKKISIVDPKMSRTVCKEVQVAECLGW